VRNFNLLLLAQPETNRTFHCKTRKN